MNTKKIVLLAPLSAAAIDLTPARSSRLTSSLAQVSSEGFHADDAVETKGNVLSQLEDDAVADSEDLTIMAESESNSAKN